MLLFDEQPIVFDRTLAREIGDRSATVLQRVHYWIEINRKNRDEKAYKDGHYWTYKSIRRWYEEDFDYLSFSTVRRTFEDLIAKEFLITGDYNKFGADRTKWYRVNKEKVKELYIKLEKEKNEKQLSNTTNAKAQNEPMQMLKMNNSEMLKMSQPIHKNNIRIINNDYISSHSNNIIYSEKNELMDERVNDENNKTNSLKKKYNTQYFKDSFGYSRVSMNKQKELDKWIKYAVDICLMPPDTRLHIGKQSVKASEVVERLTELRHEHINYIFSRLSQVKYPTNHQNYMLAVLFNAKEQYESSISTFTGGKTNNIPGKYVVPVPDYLKDRISGKSKTKDERVVTDEDEEAYKEMMSELTKGKERNDV